jgi:hypothetical protein
LRESDIVWCRCVYLEALIKWKLSKLLAFSSQNASLVIALCYVDFRIMLIDSGTSAAFKTVAIDDDAGALGTYLVWIQSTSSIRGNHVVPPRGLAARHDASRANDVSPGRHAFPRPTYAHDGHAAHATAAR